MDIIQDFIESAKNISTLAELEDLFGKVIESIGFENWGYQLNRSVLEEDLPPIIVSNYPQFWIDHYIENNYSDIDPLIVQGKKYVTPFLWSKSFDEVNPSEEQNKFLHEAEDVKLIEGFAVPIYGANGSYAMVSMTSRSQHSNELKKTLDFSKDKLHLLALVYHSIAKELVEKEHANIDNIKITKRERECLLWIAKGKTSWEISNILNISERTVIFHIENAKSKLNVYSRQQAVIKALSLNLIN